MCKYCCCDYRVPNGAIGRNIGEKTRPLFIIKYDNPINNWYYFLVEIKTNYFNHYQEEKKYHKTFDRMMPLNYCPYCGTLLV